MPSSISRSLSPPSGIESSYFSPSDSSYGSHRYDERIRCPSRHGRTGQTGLGRRAPIDNRRRGTIKRGVMRSLVLPREPDIRLALGVGQEPVDGAHPASVAGDAVMEADDHHAPPMRALLIKLVEFVAQRLLVGSWIPTHQWKGNDVVHVKGIRNRDEVSSTYRNDEGFVVARLIGHRVRAGMSFPTPVRARRPR